MCGCGNRTARGSLAAPSGDLLLVNLPRSRDIDERLIWTARSFASAARRTPPRSQGGSVPPNLWTLPGGLTATAST